MPARQNASMIVRAFVALHFMICVSFAAAVPQGDVNGDGVVNLTDVGRIKNYIVGAESLDTTQTTRADSNKDGRVDVADAVWDMQHMTPVAKTTLDGKIVLPAGTKLAPTKLTVGSVADDRALDSSWKFRTLTIWDTGAGQFLTLDTSQSLPVATFYVEPSEIETTITLTSNHIAAALIALQPVCFLIDDIQRRQLLAIARSDADYPALVSLIDQALVANPISLTDYLTSPQVYELAASVANNAARLYNESSPSSSMQLAGQIGLSNDPHLDDWAGNGMTLVNPKLLFYGVSWGTRNDQWCVLRGRNAVFQFIPPKFSDPIRKGIRMSNGNYRVEIYKGQAGLRSSNPAEAAGARANIFKTIFLSLDTLAPTGVNLVTRELNNNDFIEAIVDNPTADTNEVLTALEAINLSSGDDVYSVLKKTLAAVGNDGVYEGSLLQKIVRYGYQLTNVDGRKFGNFISKLNRTFNNVSRSLKIIDMINSIGSSAVYFTQVFTAPNYYRYDIRVSNGVLSVQSKLAPPSPALTSESSFPIKNKTVWFDASLTTDDKDPVSSMQFRYDFNGDGTWDVGWTTGKTMASYTYATTGMRTCVVEVKDSDGLTARAQFTVSVRDSAAGGNITIDVTPDSGRWRLIGPAGFTTIESSGDRTGSSVIANAPAGTYILNYLDNVADYDPPAAQTKTLASGGSIAFSGTWAKESGQVNLAISTAPDPVHPGGFIAYAVTLANRKSSSLVNARIYSITPTGTSGTYFDYEISPSPVDGYRNRSAGNKIEWSLGTIPPGQSRTVLVTLPLVSGITDGTRIQLQADAAENGTIVASATREVVVTAAAGLQMGLSADRDPVVPGEKLTYTLTYANRSTIGASSTVVSMPVPSGTTFVSAPGGSLSGGVVQWSMVSLEAGAGGQCHMVVQVNADRHGGDLIQASARALAGGFVEANATASTAVSTAPRLALTIAPGSEPVQNDGYLPYSITVTNRSATDIGGVYVGATSPAFASATYFDYEISPSPVEGYESHTSGERILWNLGTVPAGQSRTVLVSPPLVSGIANGTVIHLQAQAYADGVAGASATHDVVLTDAATLELGMSADRAPVAPGETLTYTITYGNRSSVGASGAVLTVPVPAGTTFVSAPGGAINNGIAQWNLGMVGAGVGGQHHLIVKVNTDLSGGQTITATARARTANVGGAGAKTSTHVATVPKLALSIATGSPVLDDGYLPYSITVTNRSATDIGGVYVGATSPAYASANYFDYEISPSPVEGYESHTSGERILWNLGTIPAGQSRTVLVSPPLVSGIPNGTVIHLQAQAYAEGVAGASASHDVVLTDEATLDLGISADRAPVAPGETLTYAITYGNRSSVGASGVVLTVPVPAGTTFVSAPGGAINNGIVQWNLGTVGAGAGGQRHLVVKVNADSSAGQFITALARIAASNEGGGSAIANTAVSASPKLCMSVMAGINPAQPDENLPYSVTVTNRGATDIGGVYVGATSPAFSNANYFDYEISPSPVEGYESHTSGERILWNLGTVPAGQSRTVLVSPPLVSGIPNGTVIHLQAQAYADGVAGVAAARDLVVTDAASLQLGMSADRDPVEPGQNLTYTLTYGNRSDISASGAVLSVPVPAGTTFVSATGGGVLYNGVVQWALGTIAAEGNGTLEMTVKPDSGLVDGSMVTAAARIAATNGGEASANSSVAVKANPKLSVSVHADQSSIRPGVTVTYTITVSNHEGYDITGVQVGALTPAYTNANYFDSEILPSPSEGYESHTAGERIHWKSVSVPANGTATFKIWPPRVSSIPYGTLIHFETYAVDASGNSARASIDLPSSR